MKIYTKTGDDGTTGLFTGTRVAKDDARVEAYGTVDELNALLGLLATERGVSEFAERLERVQKSLFTVGSVLAGFGPALDGRLDVASIERWIDEMEEELPSLRRFIIPGGSRPGAIAHLARTVCRRAERRVLTVARQDDEMRRVLPYLNRLSDLLFVLARWLSFRTGTTEVEFERDEV